nr:PREDICTED: TSC22 domain family protein 1 isoform X2 [Latimeria chalumnae]|eukprot:XP_006006655.1 PREDICTED: TSC22 domain family protein 1 isoform X2 [Latimeria chalumnae]
MYQPDSAADTTARKMAHPAVFPPRRGSNTSSSISPLNAAGTGISNVISTDDYSPTLLIHSSVASSSPGLQHPPPPQSLNLLSQSQLQLQSLPPTGVQIKKKSGFQITSVTPAQISASVSSNNSIAEDTESYDDLDESHTEDLSSSEILDVSLSRATDLGEPERSSSEETLNNFQEAETPGAVSPNQPHLPQHHPLPHHPQKNAMINGSIHPNQHHHHHAPHHGYPPQAHPGMLAGPGMVSTAASGGLTPSSASAKIPTTVSSEKTVFSAAIPTVAVSSAVTPASVASSISTAGTPGIINVSSVTGTNNVNNVNIPGMSNVNATIQSNNLVSINLNASNITGIGNVNTMSGTSSNMNIISGTGNGTIGSCNVINSAVTTVPVVPTSGSVVGQQQQPSTGSRFRVVKLDSSSEPYKKGRWTCTEFYDKENVASEGIPINKVVENIKQNPIEVTSERESTSGSSVSSTISTLSHYTESVGSGEMGAPTVLQQQTYQVLGTQQLDFNSTVSQSIPATSIPQSISQPQLAQVQLHSQEAISSQQKHGALHSMQANMNTIAGVQQSSANIGSIQLSLGHQQPALSTAISPIPQQSGYSQPPHPVSNLPQQQVPYPQTQQTTQLTSVHAMPVNQSAVSSSKPEYVQHQQIIQTSVPAMQPSSAVVGAAAQVPAQGMQGQLHSTVGQTQLSLATGQSVTPAQGSISSVGGGQLMSAAQQSTIPTAVQQQPGINQATASVIQPSASQPTAASQMVQPQQSNIIQQGISGSASVHAQQLVLPPHSTQPPTQPQAQISESVAQGGTSQQISAISPMPLAATVSQVTSTAPLNLTSALSSVIPPQSTTQPPSVQNGNLAQNVSQPTMISTNSSLTVSQPVPQQMVPQRSAQYPASAQTQTGQLEDTRCPVDQPVISAPQGAENVPSVVSTAVLDVTSNLAAPASLLPLKTLPLSTPFMDGEDDRAAAASTEMGH